MAFLRTLWTILGVGKIPSWRSLRLIFSVSGWNLGGGGGGREKPGEASMAEERHSRQRMEVAMATEIFAQKRVTSHVIDQMKNYEMSEERTERDLRTLYYQKLCHVRNSTKRTSQF